MRLEYLSRDSIVIWMGFFANFRGSEKKSWVLWRMIQKSRWTYWESITFPKGSHPTFLSQIVDLGFQYIDTLKWNLCPGCPESRKLYKLCFLSHEQTYLDRSFSVFLWRFYFSHVSRCKHSFENFTISPHKINKNHGFRKIYMRVFLRTITFFWKTSKLAKSR